MSPNVPPPRCPLCRSVLRRLPVVGTKELHSVCPAHLPVGACVQCGILAGKAYVEKVLVAGRCTDCRRLAAAKPAVTAGVAADG